MLARKMAVQRRRALAAGVIAAGCAHRAAQPDEVAPVARESTISTSTGPETVAPAPPVVAAPPSVEVRIDQVLVAGPGSADDVRVRLATAEPALIGCGETAIAASRAIELGFAITSGGRVPHVHAYAPADDALLACLARALGSEEQAVADNGEPTDVYVALRLVRGQDVAAAAAPPVLRDDVLHGFCDLEQVSGADRLPRDQAWPVMKTWFRDHIRHPTALHLTWKIAHSDPADTKRELERGVRAAGVARCGR